MQYWPSLCLPGRRCNARVRLGFAAWGLAPEDRPPRALHSSACPLEFMLEM